MITCNELKRCSPQIFTYSAQYQAPFYGREESRAEMEEKTAALQAGQSLVIAEPLGTGKTFLANYMISTGKIDVPRGATFLTARGIAERPETMESFPGTILVVDETDIKTTYNKLTQAMDALQSYLDSTGKKAIVLGDYSLRDDRLAGRLTKSRRLLSFEPIDREFLTGALTQRFRTFMGDFIDGDFCAEDIIDPELLSFLSPAWLKLSNSFRGIFSLLQSVVGDDRFIKYNSTKAYLKLSMFKEYLADDDGEDELDTTEQIDFLSALKEYIASAYPRGDGITRGFMVDELYQLAENADIDIAYEDFIDDILDPLAREEYLVPMGIPHQQDGAFIRRPAPYVPSLRLLLACS